MHRMKTYEGIRTDQSCTVTVNGTPLTLRHDLRNHSPTGPEWGYAGSGPTQLALALLAEAPDDDELAQDHYQKFKFQIVAGLDREQWILTQAEIRCWIAEVFSTPNEKPNDNEIPF